MGLALCKRLLAEDGALSLCLACRNPGKTDAVRTELLAQFPDAKVTSVQTDVSNLRSVLQAAEEIRRRYYPQARMRPSFRAEGTGLIVSGKGTCLARG